MYDGLVPALATAMRLTCPHLSAPNLQAIGTRVEQGIRLPRKPGWERKAAAHAQPTGCWPMPSMIRWWPRCSAWARNWSAT